MERIGIFLTSEWELILALFSLVACYFVYLGFHTAKKLSPQKLVFEMNGDSHSLFLVDIREAKEYRGHHIDGSVNYFAKKFSDISDKIGFYSDKKIVVIAGSETEAQSLANEMVLSGLNTRVLEGGIYNWVNLGFPINKNK